MNLLRRAFRTPQNTGGKTVWNGQQPIISRHITTGAAIQNEALEDRTLSESQSPVVSRRETIKTAKPFSSFLTDSFQRQHDYLRISLTEKCNLRCLYCMPEEGVPQSPPIELLTTPEIFLLSSTFVSQGVTKIRLTGGEPTVRPDILPLMHQIGSLRSQGLKELCLTTNGISLHRKLDSMVESGLTGVNLSLDTLDAWQFQIMTRRKGFDAVMKSIEKILQMNKLGAGIKLKLNCVVMRGMNDQEIIPFVEMGREKNLEVRFIEYMPFDGNKWSQGKMFSFKEMLELIRRRYPDVRKMQDHPNDTSKTYQVPGFVGRIGFITSMTHNFCGTCNRLRITSDGNLKVCLFGNAEVSLRDILRKSNNGRPIDEQALESIKQLSTKESEALLLQSKDNQELLDVIGLAVSRKRAKHAGIGTLENLKNRPMILIDEKSKTNGSLTGQTQWKIEKRSASLLAESQSYKIPSYLFQPINSSIVFRPYSTKSSAVQLERPSPALTHLNPSGHAHMVSISSKPITQRVAIATCRIIFSNTATLPLIRGNHATKGDVLGVARIAGIMAAKRTSDIIPLCHPVSLTHVGIEMMLSAIPEHEKARCRASSPLDVSRQEVGSRGYNSHTKSADASDSTDSSFTSQMNQLSTEQDVVEPMTNGANEGLPERAARGSLPVSTMHPKLHSNSPSCIVAPKPPLPPPLDLPFGYIDIHATVTCEGKTGVEMEALTAASATALTIYDMCKAVDRGMKIDGLRVLRKEGGTSGTWVRD